MTAPLWIGFAFLALLVIFLMVSFFLTPRLTPDQRGTLKFLSSLCAGFGGGFLTGSALFEMHKATGSTTFTVSGTAGFALFLVIWFFYPRVFKLDDGFEFSIPSGWTFREVVDAMTSGSKGVNEYQGFTAEELSAPIQGRRISSKSLSEGITRVRLITVQMDAVRPFDVTREDSVYRLKVR